MTRIIVTGSRNYSNAFLVQKWLNRVVTRLHSDYHEPPVLIHGAAPGADTLAEEYWIRMGWPIEAYPTDWETHGSRAGYLRNKEMAESGADICVAFPQGESKSTRMMMKLAEEYGITVLDVEQAEKEGK